ncbi:MAG TPA: hypothetical protein VIJ25_08215 [Methylococcales bacterium]|jgi:hypothetical protein
MSMSFQTAENQMKALKSLLIKLPTAIALVSMLVIFIIAICVNPMIPILMMHQSISLSSHVPLSFSVWLLLSALMGVLALTRRKRGLGLKSSGKEM